MTSPERIDYQSLAIRTEAQYDQMPTRAGSIQICRILHASIGLCTEVGELVDCLEAPEFEQHAKEEVGDLWWYTAILFHASLRPLHNLAPLKQSTAKYHLNNITSAIGNIQDVVKRTLFYGKPVDHMRLAAQSDRLVEDLVAFGHAVGIRAEEAQRANIAKLSKRYPEKFTEHNATNRNLEEERLALK